MTELAYNNAKNASTNHISFEPNYGYHLHVFFEKVTNLCSQLKIADKLSTKLQKLMIVCQENFYHAQKLQKQTYNKNVKPKSYASIIKFGYIANTSKPNKTESLRPSFLNRSKCYIL